MMLLFFFFFNDTATTEIYTLSLHDALPIYVEEVVEELAALTATEPVATADERNDLTVDDEAVGRIRRSEEHTSELQSRQYLVCRLLLEKKKKTQKRQSPPPNHHCATHRTQI